MKAQIRTRLLSYLFVFLILLLCSVTAFSGAEEKPCSITLRYELSDAEFSIYKIGNINFTTIFIIIYINHKILILIFFF